MIQVFRYIRSVAAHYERNLAGLADILQTIESGAPLDPASFDQFHLMGLHATRRMAEFAGVRPGMRVLDAGSGLGGPSRFLARECDAVVTGVDLTPAFVAIARALAPDLEYRVGDLLHLEFQEAEFDLVWTQHVVMNIEDRAGLYREFHRVLKPGGALAFFDVCAAEGRPAVEYPTPWAESASSSFLLTPAETETALTAAGFHDIVASDLTDDVLNAPPPTPAPFTLANVMGPQFPRMFANLRANLTAGRLRVVMGRATR